MLQVRANAITTLEEEHLDALGGSIRSIAAAKAGIVHPGTLAVIGSQDHKDADGALQDALTKIPSIQSVWVPRNALVDCGVRSEGNGCLRQSATAGPPLLPTLGASPLSLSMVGSHNVLNAATAATVLAEMASQGSVNISQEAIRTGLERAQMPGRFDIRWKESPGGTSCTVASCISRVERTFSTWPELGIQALCTRLMTGFVQVHTGYA